MAREINPEQLRNNHLRHQELRASFLERSRQEAVVRNRTRLPMTDSADLIRRRRAMRQVRAYYAQAYRSMLLEAENVLTAYGLVDRDGCMIRLHGTLPLLSVLERKGIRPGTFWDFRTSGCNAVTIGLETGKTISTQGYENYLPLLQDLAIYYAPLETGLPDRSVLGGVVLLSLLEDANPVFLAQTAGLAGSLMVRLSMAWRISESYDAEDSRGMVMLDINTGTGSVTITHHNKALFSVLEVPPVPFDEAYFKPFEELVDPPPRNQRLWNIIMHLEEVQDEKISLSLHGNRLECIISARPYSLEGIQSKGTLLYLTTNRRISRQISEKTSNSAIISAKNIIGESNVIRSRLNKARLLAGTDSNVMILGESGVGKDVFAQAIHNMSARSGKPFVAVNCGALPRDLIESELFGYEGGAFTGARKQGNIGKFELADGGTLFLDEIGELPLDLQATLLRVVEQKSFMRLGGTHLIYADVKIISATNANILRMVDEKKFRSDLYYRLGTMQLYLPPLREREGDAVLLAEYFIRRISDRIGRSVPALSEDARVFISAYPWKGNVRELQNVMERVVQLYSDPVVTWHHLAENVDPSYLPGLPGPSRDSAAPASQTSPAEKQAGIPDLMPAGVFSHQRPRLGNKNLVTREEILEALATYGNNRTLAAKMLGIGRKTLYRYMDRYSIN